MTHPGTIYTLTLNPAMDRELHVRDIRLNSVLRADSVAIDYGGKGLNVSRALKALGVDSIALGWIGGMTGLSLRQGLERLGIQTDFLEIAGETRTDISVVSSEGGQHLKVNEPGPRVNDTDVAALLAQVSRLAHKGDWWVLSGSLPPGAPENLYSSITTLVQAAGSRVILDSSGPPLSYGCLASPYLVKPNALEASQLSGRPVHTIKDACQAATVIQALGIAVVVISMGKDGALLSTTTDCYFYPPARIIEQNPTGAGDAQVAGLVYGLWKGETLIEAMRWGAACGAAAASLPGTSVGSLEQVTSLREAVQPILWSSEQPYTGAY